MKRLSFTYLLTHSRHSFNKSYKFISFILFIFYSGSRMVAQNIYRFLNSHSQYVVCSFVSRMLNWNALRTDLETTNNTSPLNKFYIH